MMYQASRNERLSSIISNLREQIQRFRLTSLSHPGRMQESLSEHKKITEAIQSRDGQLARQLAQEHIENAENVLIECLKIESQKKEELL
jgi:DNA-binding FadR family transcriptional regulator